MNLSIIKGNGFYGIKDAFSDMILVAPEYGYLELYGPNLGRAIAWKNCKGGVINAMTGEEVIPIRFDEVYLRLQRGPKDEHGRPTRPTAIGYACFTDEGESCVFDMDGNIDFWRDWEHPMIEENREPCRPLEDIERDIFAKFREVNLNQSCLRFDFHRSAIQQLLYERKHAMNRGWIHTPEHVARIAHINSLVEKAVHRAIEMGQKAEKALSFLRQGDDARPVVLFVEIYPIWEDSILTSNLHADNYGLHDIIVMLGEDVGETILSPFFSIYCDGNDPECWDYNKASMDDGISWDEGGFHRPAYQNCYFLRPFQRLSFDNYIAAFEDLTAIKDFKIFIKCENEHFITSI